MSAGSLPLPDVLRLVRRARKGGPYSAAETSTARSPVERFTLLYRALEHLARYTGAEIETTLFQGLTDATSAHSTQAIREMARIVGRLTPGQLGSLVDEGLEGAARDAAIASLRSSAKLLAAEPFRAADLHERRRVGRLIRSPRNAAIHAKVMTRDHEIGPVFAFASMVLDGVVVTMYARAFQVSAQDVARVLAVGRDAG